MKVLNVLSIFALPLIFGIVNGALFHNHLGIELDAPITRKLVAMKSNETPSFRKEVRNGLSLNDLKVS